MSTSARFTRLSSDAVMLHLSGEFDLATMATQQAYLRGAMYLSRDLVVDMSDVSFFDCAALSVLIWARNEVVPVGGSITLLAPAPSVTRLIDAARLRDAFRVSADLPALSA